MFAPTGIKALDETLGGGLPSGSATIVRGGAGSGKTTMGLQFCVTGARQGETALFVTMEELRQQLHHDAATLGWNLEELIDAGTLHLEFVPVHAVGEMFRMLETIQPRRFVLDSLNHLTQWDARTDAALREKTNRLLLSAKRHGTTAAYLWEEDPAGTPSPAAFTADNIIEMGTETHGDSTLRMLRVIKGRGIRHSLSPVPFVIGPGGLCTAGGAQPSANYRSALPFVPAAGRITAVQEEILGAPLRPGSLLVVERSSAVQMHGILAPLLMEFLHSGWGVLLYVMPSGTTRRVADILEESGWDWPRLAAEERLLLLDEFGVLRGSALECVTSDPRAVSRDELIPTLLERIRHSGRPWLWLNSIANTARLFEFPDRVTQVLDSITGQLTRGGGLLLTDLLVPSIPDNLVAAVESRSDTVLRLWTEGRYHVGRFVKHPQMQNSDIMLIDFLDRPPFLKLLR